MTQYTESWNTMQRQPEPVFDMEEFEDELMTAQQYYRFVTIKYEGYEFDGAFRIVKLSVNLGDLMEHHFEYLEDQVREAIGLRINKHNIVLECKLEIV